MRKLFFILAILSATAIQAQNQTWERVRNDTGNYISGEGWGDTLEEADQQALASLVSKISTVVSSNYEVLEGESKTGDGQDYDRYIRNKVSTFANATLTNTECLIISNEPDAHVARWIRRDEIERIFEGRKSKVMEYIASAVKGESLGKVDDALRNYYWAYSLLKTLQRPSEIKYTDSDGESHTLVSWIPAKMDEIFDDIVPSVTGRDGDEVQLRFTFRGKPVSSLDYTYFDGSRWSNLYSAKDGRGILELSPGSLGENLQIKYEFAYRNEAHIDKELYSVISVVRGNSFKASYVTIKGKVDKSTVKEQSKEDRQMVVKTKESFSKSSDESSVRQAVKKLTEAIKTKNYSAADPLFTADGMDMYHRLVSYGNASLVGTPTYSVYPSGERNVVRSIPMSFSFSRGVRKSFVEDVVLTFNEQGLIECLAFALDDEATTDIMQKQAWPEDARKSIIEFLENYKTAFALKRLDYIKTIFDDNAVIIVGKVAKVASSANPDAVNINATNRIVTRTRYNKEQYINNLSRCFASNEFVNIRFANNDVVKAGRGGEIYGIQIKQDYYSTNYGDTGYLFLMVDLNNPVEPVIKVRTWQPEPDPVDGLFDISDF